LNHRPSLRVAYLASRYPAVTHTFIANEVRALRATGVSVEPVTVRRPEEREVLGPVDRAEHARTHALVPTSARRLVGDHIHAFARAPLAYAGTLVHAMRLSTGGPRALLWQLFYFAEAILLWRWMDGRGLRHLHVHFSTPAGDVAMLSTRFGQRAARAGDRWTWSMTVHGPTELREPGRNKLAAKVAAADAVVCISDFARSQVAISAPEQWGKLTTVRMGIDLSMFAPSEPADERPGMLRILNVAAMRPQKGQALLLEALAKLRGDGVDAHLTIVGDGPEREHLESRVAQLGIAEHVEMPGALGHDAIPRHMQEADVFCLPSFAEGVPTVLMEAMASGLPVVATYVGGVPDLVEPGTSGLLVSPGSADLLADALARLAADPGLRRRLVDSGLARVSANHDVHRQVGELRAVLEAVAGVR
jgi:glycosyltransferase involved in cell wall biosynthesis